MMIFSLVVCLFVCLFVILCFANLLGRIPTDYAIKKSHINYRPHGVGNTARLCDGTYLKVYHT